MLNAEYQKREKWAGVLGSSVHVYNMTAILGKHVNHQKNVVERGMTSSRE